MDFLYNYGFDNADIDIMTDNMSEEEYSEITLLKNLIGQNIAYLRDFGITNYKQVVIKYHSLLLRDNESFKNVLNKFDKEDLIQKVAKNPAVIKKMVDYVDNN